MYFNCRVIAWLSEEIITFGKKFSFRLTSLAYIHSSNPIV